MEPSIRRARSLSQARCSSRTLSDRLGQGSAVLEVARLVDAAERARWDGNRDVLLDVVAQIMEHVDDHAAELVDVLHAVSEHFFEGTWIEPKRTVRRWLIE